MTAEKYFFLFCTIMFTLYNPQEPLEVECYRVRGTVYADMWGKVPVNSSLEQVMIVEWGSILLEVGSTQKRFVGRSGSRET